MDLPFSVASSKNDCYFRHMCVCPSVARWQRFAKLRPTERAIKIRVENQFFFVHFVFGVFTVLRTTNKHR